MFLPFIVVLVAFTAVISAAGNLREAALPEIEKSRVIRAVQEFYHAAINKHKHDIQMVTTQISSVESKLKSHLAAQPHAGAKANKIATDTTSSTPHPVRMGYTVTRHRPNTDCSGQTSLTSGYMLDGACHSYPGMGYSYYTACGHEDAMGFIPTTSYGFRGVEDCSGPPSSVYTIESTQKCAINGNQQTNAGERSVLEMLAQQCSSQTNVADIVQPGFVFSNYGTNDTSCTGPVTNFVNTRFNSCLTEVENLNSDGSIGPTTAYVYSTLSGCGRDGKLVYTQFSDSACTRPIRQISAPLREIFPSVGVCGHEATSNTNSVFTCISSE